VFLTSADFDRSIDRLIDCTVEMLCYSALEKIILNGYSALGLMYFFTVGEDEVKAWTIQVCYNYSYHRLVFVSLCLGRTLCSEVLVLVLVVCIYYAL